MNTTVVPSSVQMTIDIKDVSIVNDLRRILKHVQGVGKISVSRNYYGSEKFYQDIDQAEADIANGNGKVVANAQDLDALFI